MTVVGRAESTEGLAELHLNSTGEGIYGIDLQGNCSPQPQRTRSITPSRLGRRAGSSPLDGFEQDRGSEAGISGDGCCTERQLALAEGLGKVE